MEALKNLGERFESKALGAQGTGHTGTAGEDRTPRNAANEPRSKLLRAYT
jgi:hypothetical protein